MSRNQNEKRVYTILVYGIEKKGLTPPEEGITKRNFNLIFEPFSTNRRFNEFDGVILFQGIFEKFERKNGGYLGEPYLAHRYAKDELDKRLKELDLLLNNKGFVCFVLCEPFIDRDSGTSYESTDLTKICLNASSFYRNNFSDRLTNLVSKRNEFSRFIDLYGAASTFFENYNDNIEMRVLAALNNRTVGMIMWDERFFVPSLLPENIPDRITEYFSLLAEAITSTVKKLSIDVPKWVNAFIFSQENHLDERQDLLVKELREIDEEKKLLRFYKRILIADGDPLVEAVVRLFKMGFGMTVDDSDEYREDIKILDSAGTPIIFAEIKGTNRGVKREHINQADSHRDRAGLTPEFPSLLIINTHIKNSRTIEEKDKDVPAEQIQHASRNHILILRTLDVLRLLRLCLDHKIELEDLIKVLVENSGWLKVSDDDWEVIHD